MDEIDLDIYEENNEKYCNNITMDEIDLDIYEENNEKYCNNSLTKKSRLLKLFGFGNITKELNKLRKEISELRLTVKILEERNAYLVKKNSLLLNFSFENNL